VNKETTQSETLQTKTISSTAQNLTSIQSKWPTLQSTMLLILLLLQAIMPPPPPLGAMGGNNAAAAAQLAQQILKNTNITLKQEVIKLPDIFGQTGKDTISALDFISRIDKCQVLNNWTDVTTCANFTSVFKGRLKNGSLPNRNTLKSHQHRKPGPGSDPFLKMNLLRSQMTS